jgi:hypothetical protein
MTYKDNVQHKTDWQDLLNQEFNKEHSTTIWDFRSLDKLEILLISDVHLGHRCCDEDMFMCNIDLVLKRKMHVADLGDLIENATRDSIGAGVYDQKAIAETQMQRAVELYNPIRDLIQVMYPGNHELRTYDKSGVNLTKLMAKELGTKYGGLGGFNTVKVGNQKYTMYLSHGGSGATTVGGKIAAMMRLGQTIDAEVLGQGHVHDTIYHSREMLQTDMKGEITKKKQHLIVNGAYLNWWGSYAQVKAYPIGNKGSAKITFYGEEHKIEVSFI